MKKPIYIKLKCKGDYDHSIKVVGTDGDAIADVTKKYRVLGIEILDYDYITIDGKKRVVVEQAFSGGLLHIFSEDDLQPLTVPSIE
jgi:hypothetical protein